MDEILRTSLLLDLYGELLTEKQCTVMKLYHEENLSLSEIADELEISRQAVHDTLKKAESELEVFEQKLGLLKKMQCDSKAANSLREIASNTDADTSKQLLKIAEMIENGI